MPVSSERWAPKVHPATRAVEAEDPMELHATAAPGDPEVLLRCLVQEYAWMGWGVEQILGLFRDPFYPALNELLRAYGEAGIRERVTALLGRMGVLRFHAVEAPPPGPEEEGARGPELIQLGFVQRRANS
jgi:hypothetical protein